jgi:hypothetical protein
LRILVAGNGFTARNNFPEHIAQMAAAGATLSAEQYRTLGQQMDISSSDHRLR